jgi:transglutaminase-like putative cysteine protease
MMLDLTVRIFKHINMNALLAFLLLLGVLGSVAYGLSEIITALSFSSLFVYAITGLWLGRLLGRTKLRAWSSASLIVLIGVTAALLWVGNLIPPLVNLSRAAALWASGYLQNQPEIIENITPIQLALTELSFSINSIWLDLTDWGQSLSSASPITQISVIFLIWGLMVWMVSAWAGWVHRRYHNVMLSIMPASVLLVATLGYTWSNPSSLIPLLFFSLLLMASTWLNKIEEHWQSDDIDYPVDARTDTLIAAVTISLILVLLANFLPRISVRKIAETIQNYTNPPIEEVQPIIESIGIEVSKPSIGRFGSMLEAGLPRDHLIGAGPELSEQVVMTVQISGGLPPSKEASEYIPLYWRGLTYDRYTGTGWNSSDVTLQRYAPEETIIPLDRSSHRIIQQEIRFTDESNLLFAAGDLITADERFRVAWRSEPLPSRQESNPADFFGAAIDELSYQAKSFVPVTDRSTLRETSFLYPDGIRDNYTLVPVRTPQRVIEHTLSLTEDVQNPYDRAMIIENYLRQFEYTTDLPAPPEDRDIVEYFLFDLQKGYCDYFATAMVVMARAAYMPARLVVGYSRGTYDQANDRYVITEADAHSWAEIYFTGVGWVPFEPTPARSEIARSDQPLAFPEESSYNIDPESLLPGIQPLFGSWLITSLVFGIGLVWIGMVWLTVDDWWLKRNTHETMAAKLYLRLYKHGRRLGIPVQKETTPSEFLTTFREQVASLPIRRLAIKQMEQLNQGVDRFTNIYIQAQYSSKGLENENKRQTIEIWSRLRRQLLIAQSLAWAKRLRHKQRTDNEANHLE